MAKVPFSKLGLKKINEEIKIIKFNDIDIEVKQYLPIDDKLQLVVNVISNAADGNRFYNPIKIDAFAALEILFMYTNLTFTDTQKKDLSKLYDLIVSNGLFQMVKEALPDEEYDELMALIYDSADNIYTQMNSAISVVEAFTNRDPGDMTKQATELQEKLADPKNLNLIREIMTQLD